MTKPATVIKKFLKAKTEVRLERQMLINNIKYRTCFDYTDIQKVGGTWYAWYEVDAKVTALMDSLKVVK